MDRFPHKFLIRFLLVLVSVMLLLVVFEWIEINFKAKTFPVISKIPFGAVLTGSLLLLCLMK